MNKENSILIVDSFNKDEMLQLKDLLSSEKKCRSLTYMFDNIDKFLYFISQGGSVCVYFDSNGFNGYTKEDPMYLPNKEQVDFNTFKTFIN